jgi:hypothetical protein
LIYPAALVCWVIGNIRAICLCNLTPTYNPYIVLLKNCLGFRNIENNKISDQQEQYCHQTTYLPINIQD